MIQLSNWGNAPAQLRMNASDPDDALGFYLSPEIVNLPPGGRASVRFSARTKHPFLRGTPVRLPFQVVGERLDAAAGPPPAAGMGYGDPVPARRRRRAESEADPVQGSGHPDGVAAGRDHRPDSRTLQTRPEIPHEPLAPRGAPPKPQLTVTSARPGQRRPDLDAG